MQTERNMYKNEFVYSPVINTQCNGCGKCIRKCRQDVLEITREMDRPIARIKHPECCKGCEKCRKACPMDAIRIITTEITKPLNHKKTMKPLHFKNHPFHPVLFFLLFTGITAAIVMLLWNALIPGIIGWTTINYWQAAGLFILCQLLFRGIWPHHWSPREHAQFHQGHAEFHEKIKNMTREERIRYIRKQMTGLQEQTENERTE